MLPILNALVPVFLVIALGFVIRRKDFPGEGLWVPLDQINYYVLFPALLCYTLAVADIVLGEVGAMAAALAAGMLAMVVLLMLSKRLLPMTGAEFSSVFQGAARWNSFVALAAIASLWGKPGLTLAAVAVAVMVPIANIVSVTVLTRYAGSTPAGPATVAKLLSRNPLILACAAGIALNLTGIGLPGPLATTFKIVGDASLTLGLLAVGAGLQIVNVLEKKWIVLYTSFLKLIAMPFIMMGFCLLFGVEGLPRLVVLICAAVPGATSSYMLARQLGGDMHLMASLITGGTILAVVTMPLMLWLLG
ncbi:Auxin Efflux Carrier [Parvibaculum lavamentivorans DS-1]|uniref:Auxin Efflux Carrier n=1 Tax=Parvibaculum lavamentivorans (strain DS-1 / DSM 13023 / NCIMB 13966) TaxID=402881 RepID=A7HX14_PARL1|nr:AEC family transporter [Parvibaculum lavamentivorans]ABS64447.1 Auxin Efflux Carrier [Parvibaculum lavamentivorans DS-1]